MSAGAASTRGVLVKQLPIPPVPSSVTTLMSDVTTGTIREDILNEKVLSAIVEIKVPKERAEEIIRLVKDVEARIDTVVSIGAGVRCDENGEDDIVGPIFERLGYTLARAKTNVGLGKRYTTAGVPAGDMVNA